MKWSAIAVLVVLGTLAALTIVGTLLPREHRASRAAEFHQSPDTIWAALTDFASFPSWMPGVSRVTAVATANGAQRWSLISSDGDMLIEIVEAHRPARLVTRIVDNGGPWGGTWTYEIAPLEGATRLRITEDGWIGNPLLRVLGRYVFGTTRTLDGALRGLGEHLGEPVRPTAG